MIHITDNEEKLRQILSKMLSEIGNTCIYIVKEEGVFKIMKKEDLLSEVSLRAKIKKLGIKPDKWKI